MPNGEICNKGQWVAVLYGRKASVGKVVDIPAKDSAKVHFLKGKKMAKNDVQDVHNKFLVCRVDVNHDSEREEIVLTEQSSEKIKRETSLYIEKYM